MKTIRTRGKSKFRTLVKYDLKVLSKIMIPLWGVMIVFGLIRGMQEQVNNMDYIDVDILIQ